MGWLFFISQEPFNSAAFAGVRRGFVLNPRCNLPMFQAA